MLLKEDRGKLINFQIHCFYQNFISLGLINSLFYHCSLIFAKLLTLTLYQFCKPLPIFVHNAMLTIIMKVQVKNPLHDLQMFIRIKVQSMQSKISFSAPFYPFPHLLGEATTQS